MKSAVENPEVTSRLAQRIVFFTTIPNEKKGLTGAVVGTDTVLNAMSEYADVEIVELRHTRIRVMKLGLPIRALISFIADYIASLSSLRKVLSVPGGSPTTLYLSAASSLGGCLRDTGAILLASLKNSETRIVLHSRNGNFFFPESVILRMLRKWELDRADRVVCLSRRLLPSNSELERLMGSSAHERIRIVPNTIDQALVASVKEVDSKLERNGPITVLYLSNFIPTKGYLLLADAICQIERAGRLEAFRFVFRGNWPNPAKKNALRERLGESVMGSGTVDIGAGIWERKEVRKTLLSADIFCLPTSYKAEAQPRSILEAMACGCAILANDHASIADMVCLGENGYLVRDITAEDIASYLMSLDRTEIMRLARNSRMRFDAQFSRTAHEEAIRDAIICP